MADINTVAKQFTDFYYSTFDTNRASLQSLYVGVCRRCLLVMRIHLRRLLQREASMLSWEGQPFQGVVNITEKLSVSLSLFCRNKLNLRLIIYRPCPLQKQPTKLAHWMPSPHHLPCPVWWFSSLVS